MRRSLLSARISRLNDETKITVAARSIGGHSLAYRNARCRNKIKSSPNAGARAFKEPMPKTLLHIAALILAQSLFPNTDLSTISTGRSAFPESKSPSSLLQTEALSPVELWNKRPDFLLRSSPRARRQSNTELEQFEHPSRDRSMHPSALGPAFEAPERPTRSPIKMSNGTKWPADAPIVSFHSVLLNSVFENLDKNVDAQDLGINSESVLNSRLLNVGVETSDGDFRIERHNLVSELRVAGVRIVGITLDARPEDELQGIYNQNVTATGFRDGQFDGAISVRFFDPTYFNPTMAAMAMRGSRRIRQKDFDAAEAKIKTFYRDALQEISRVLAPRGFLLVSTGADNPDFQKVAEEGFRIILLDPQRKHQLLLIKKDDSPSKLVPRPAPDMPEENVNPTERAA
jgi:hypothetical protein